MNAASSQWLILDACCVLNLYATDCMEEILRSVALPCAIAEKVEDEALFILRGGAGADAGDKIAVDLPPLYRAGVLTVLPLESVEISDYVNFAAEVDDGEAMTCAIAVHRGVAVATDDRKARRLLSRDAPHLVLHDTPSLLEGWARNEHIDIATLRDVLVNVRDRARYQPARSHPLRTWWDAAIQ